MTAHQTQNLLADETSPYLLQHANNPVHWMAWNEQSLALAKELNKPILLSIGYSACHWCHVMAHESFQDNETAELMNQLYINIKVDKEERPDLDKIYQNAHSLLTERPGGWPLTVFLTPDNHMPIFAGTYFPLQPSHGLPAFKSLLIHINEIWSTRKDDIQQQSAALQSTYQQIYTASKPAEADLDSTALDIARSQIEKQFDAKNGGFSGAPKFPHPAILDFALKHWIGTQKQGQSDPRILHSAIFTLEKMADGGIFDHLGGGFCRYSTDELWMIPHFEKMLYDNGPLLSLYSQAWKLNQDPLFYDAACTTADWVIREMQSPDGGYYAAQDADSEGHEGRFFVWSKHEIDEQLNSIARNQDIDDNAIDAFRQRFGLHRDANFEGYWHLHGYIRESTLASKQQIDQEYLHRQLQNIRRALFEYREKRVHPDTDRKILCAWNGLMIHGMAKTGRLLNKPECTKSAIKAACFIRDNCWHSGRLFAGTKDGKTTLNAYLDDYAFLIYGLLEVLQNQWHETLYEWTLELAEKLIEDFEDTQYGGFYFTSHHHENLIQRLKSFSDDAIPSGNGIAALALNRLGMLSGRKQYIEAAERSLQSAWRNINHSPLSHCAMLNALREFRSPPTIIIMRLRQADFDSWQASTKSDYLPDTLIYSIPAESTIHPTLQDKAAETQSVAYPCQGLQCFEPLTSTAELQEYLRNNSYRVLE